MGEFNNLMNRYGLSKLANVLFSNELQRRFDEKEIDAVALSVHPGAVLTGKFGNVSAIL